MPEVTSIVTFPAMLRRVLGNRLRPDTETFPDMFAVHGVLEYPFAPPGLNTPLVGRDAIIANFQRLRLLFRVDEVTDVCEITAVDPNVVVLEFNGRGLGLVTQEVYNQRYISVIHVADGNIVHYKDYWNPIAFLRAIKGSEIMKLCKMD